LGSPILAFGLVNIKICVGKIAISSRIIPQAAYCVVAGNNNEIPKTISIAPLKMFSKEGLGK
jgi:hypothetical protein